MEYINLPLFGHPLFRHFSFPFSFRETLYESNSGKHSKIDTIQMVMGIFIHVFVGRFTALLHGISLRDITMYFLIEMTVNVAIETV